MLNCLLRLDELSSLADASPSLSPDMPMAFSIATQSNVVELWVHYCDQSPPHTYCMARVATFDCVVDRDNCAAFLRMRAAVLQWGSRELKGWCDERRHRTFRADTGWASAATVRLAARNCRHAPSR